MLCLDGVHAKQNKCLVTEQDILSFMELYFGRKRVKHTINVKEIPFYKRDFFLSDYWAKFIAENNLSEVFLYFMVKRL